MSNSLDDERILNVFREHLPDTNTLTTKDLAEELSIHNRTAQNYVNDLKVKNRLVLESEGKPNHWRLADTEPVKPVYSARLARTKRRANQAAKVGRTMFLLGVSILAASGLVTSNHVYAEAIGIYIPFLNANAAASAVVTGVIGSIIFGVSSVALLFSVAFPRVVEWYIDDPLPDET